ncbi:MAG TPA: sigma-54 dependent transcriptional regulator [Polyangia bacterium]
MERVLVVDDEEGIRDFIGEVLEGEGLRVTSAADGQQAAALLDRQSFHLMVTDLKMPRLGGMELLRKARAEQPEMEVIVLTAHGTVQSAVEAMKLGAFDYLAKPLSGPDELRLVAARALERRRLREERQRHVAPGGEPETLIARDPAMLAVALAVRKVAPTDATVLLLGESGTGKEVVARTLHRESRRREGPFVAVNCAALSDTLLESEVFGHEKGAFTGAVAARRGRFELADGGTLFLDEVAELRPQLQAKLLRVLQERHFERVGGTRTIEVDVRVLAATNRDLGEELRAGRFREDLYHRLAVFPVALPPLRDRPGDVLPLAEHLLTRAARQLGRPGLELDDSARAALAAYAWPGNVRELANVLERGAILAEGREISAEHLRLGVGFTPTTFAPTDPVFEGTLADLEREAIRRVLAATGGHRKKAAARLGIGLRTLYEKLREYKLG